MSSTTGRRRRHILPVAMGQGNADDVTAWAGLMLVLETMRALRLEDVAAKHLPVGRRQRGFSPEEKLEALVLLLAAGGERVEDIRRLAEDKGLERLLGAPFPSPDALLDFLRQFHDDALVTARPEGKLAYVPPESEALKGLAAINTALVARGASVETTTATIDADGTIIEAHKREATMAYEGTRGYQPLVAVWAEEGLVVADEFRDGNVAGGEDPLSCAKRAFESLPPQVKQRYYRADSASYYGPLLKYLVGEGIGFSISADMTKELRAACQALPETDWALLEERTTETVHVAEVEFTPGNWPKDAAPLRYVAMRFSPMQGSFFEERGPKRLAIVTNRRELSAPELVKWHWGKAGTIEHVHRAMKDELGAGTLPSGRFGANAAWFRINALVFNILTVLKRRALPESLLNARPRRLRFECFTVPAKLVLHQSELTAVMGVSSERLSMLVEARGRLFDLRDAAT